MNKYLDEMHIFGGERDRLSFDVVIAAFNAEDTVRAAILSAISAGSSDVIVIDDGSVDETMRVAVGAGAQVHRQKNAGAANARLHGLQFVHSKFVVFLDADDVLRPSGIHVALCQLSQDIRAVGVLGNTETADEGRPAVALHSWGETVTVMSLLTRGRAPGPPGAFVWKTVAVAEAVKNLPVALSPRFAEDYELVIRMAAQGPIRVIDSVICGYSTTGGKSAVKPMRSLRESERIRRHYAKFYGVQIRLRSPADLRALSIWRRAAGESSVTRKTLLASAAALRSPSLFWYLRNQRSKRTRSMADLRSDSPV